MQQLVYTPEELERIQMGVLALLCYAKRHDWRELPRCFLFCRTMVKNIDRCREGGHTPEDRAELSQCIREDWKCAMEARAGLPEYYLPDTRLEVQRGMAQAIGWQIDTVDRLIFSREKGRAAEVF